MFKEIKLYKLAIDFMLITFVVFGLYFIDYHNTNNINFDQYYLECETHAKRKDFHTNDFKRIVSTSIKNEYYVEDERYLYTCMKKEK